MNYFYHFVYGQNENRYPLRFAIYIPDTVLQSPEFIEILNGEDNPDKHARLSLIQVATFMVEEKDFKEIPPETGVGIESQAGSKTINSGVLVAKSDKEIDILSINSEVKELVKIAYRHLTRQVRLDVK